MKIGLVCPYNMFRGGGVQEHVLALREGLVKRGHEAFIISPQPTNPVSSDVDTGMLLVGSARPIRAARTSAEVSVSVDTDKLNSLLDSHNFDILHFHEPWVPILSLQIMQRSKAVHIATFHAAMSERRTSRTVEKVIIPYTRSIFKYVNAMTAVSSTATNYVSTLTNRKLVIIPNGIDLQKYNEPHEFSNSKIKTILYVGRLEKRKGVKYLLEAYDRIATKDHNYRLLIAGDGPERAKLMAQVEKDSIKGVQFLGYIDEAEKLRLLKESTIFCSPALYGESFGIVLLEAMASGCVTVAGNNSGYEQVMRGRGQLSIVNPKDTTEFARRLDLLAKDESLRDNWREWARKEVVQYDYSEIVDQYEKLYIATYDKKHA